MKTRILSYLSIIVALLMLSACGSSSAQTVSSAASPASAPPAAATTAPAVKPTEAAAVAPPAATLSPQSKPSGTPGLSNRVSDSVNKLLLFDHKVLDSYRIEMTGVEPRLDIVDNTLSELKFKRQIEIAGDNVHLISHLTEKGEETTREGYIIGGSHTDMMKDYEIKDGKLADSSGMVSVGFAMFPLSVGAPVLMGAQGATLAGEETIEGRAAEKWVLDSASIPKEALEFTGFKSIKGTAWVDKETGTLLKLVLDYAQEFVDPDPNSDKILGVGQGHIDLLVSQIGQVKVTLPQ